MAERAKRRKSIYEMIVDTRKKISNTEERLAQLKQELDVLYKTLFDEYAKQNEIEMRKLFDLIGMKHIPLIDIIKLLEEQK